MKKKRIAEIKLHSDINYPLISIITVVYNGEKYLEQTIKSVLDQTYDNVEYIIVDGGSTDKTLDIINKYDEYIDYWISEPDTGIFDAMNKGLRIATGEYIHYLNADDKFKKNILERFIKDYKHNQDVEFFFGDIDVVSNTGIYLKTQKGQLINDILGLSISHQACFIKLSTHKLYPFDTTYKIVSDRIVITNMLLNGHKKKYLNYSIADFMDGGTSSNQEYSEKEMLRYRLKYLDSVKNNEFKNFFIDNFFEYFFYQNFYIYISTKKECFKLFLEYFPTLNTDYRFYLSIPFLLLKIILGIDNYRFVKAKILRFLSYFKFGSQNTVKRIESNNIKGDK